MKRVLSLLLIAVLLLSVTLPVPALAVGELPEEGNAPVSAEMESVPQTETEDTQSDADDAIEADAADATEEPAAETAGVPAEGGEAPQMLPPLEREQADAAALTPIPAVAVTVTPPAAGSSAADAAGAVSVPTGAGYSVIPFATCYDQAPAYDDLGNPTTTPFTGSFEGGKTYYMDIGLRADAGYMFQQGGGSYINTTVTVNGATLTSGTNLWIVNTWDETTGMVSYGSLTVSFTVPAASARNYLSSTNGGAIDWEENTSGDAAKIGTVSAGNTIEFAGYYALPAGSSVNLTATPASGYTFKGWYTEWNSTSPNLVSSSATYTWALPTDIGTTLTAAFEEESASGVELTLCINNDSVSDSYSAITTGGAVQISGRPETGFAVSAELAAGSSVTAVAAPDNGYTFVKWTKVDGTEVSTSASYTFDINEEATLVAHFERVYRDVWIDNTVDNSVSHVTGVVHITGSGGTQAGYNPGVTIYSEDASVTFSNPRTAQVQGHIDAAYTQVYGLANTCKSNGKSGEFHMSTTESTGRVWDNRRYETLEDASEPTEVGGTWAFPRTHIASGDYGKETFYRVEANGWVSGYEITVTTEGSGTASADLAASLAGETVTLTATPDTNSRFKEWQVVSGGMTLSGDSFTMPAADVAVKAVFVPIPVYTVTIVTDGGSVSADQTVAEGGRIARPADPVKDGSVFAGWYGDAAFTAAFDFDAPITADTTVYARWTATPTPTATPTASSTASPKTGDDTAAGVWSALTLVSGLALAGLALIGRRRRTDR